MEKGCTYGKKARIKSEVMKGKHKTISIDRIQDPEAPLRSDLSHEAVDDLVQSIKRIGIIEPLIVRKVGDDFEVIAGHRRLVASEIVGLTEVPCIVVEMDNEEAEIVKLHENLNRSDINPIDWANHLYHLKQQYQYSTAKLAEILGMSEAWVSQHLGILEYDPALLEGLKHNLIAFSSARELAQIKDPKTRGVYVKHAIVGGVTPKLAARWRKEANREPMKDQTVENVVPQENEEDSTLTVLPICPVCDHEIKPEEELRITIHQSCQPQQ